jgi:hypothetical protein
MAQAQGEGVMNANRRFISAAAELSETVAAVLLDYYYGICEGIALWRAFGKDFACGHDGASGEPIGAPRKRPDAALDAEPVTANISLRRLVA